MSTDRTITSARPVTPASRLGKNRQPEFIGRTTSSNRLPLKSVNQSMSFTLRSVQSAADPRPAERPEPQQAVERGIELIRVPYLQTDRLHGIRAGLECQRVVAKIGPERRQMLGTVDRLDADHALREVRRALQVIRGETDVSQLLKHRDALLRKSSPL